MTDAQRQIAFDQAGLGNVLKRHQLAVPSNQREYAWTEREITQLFQDYAKAVSNGVDYFLGTIVTIPRSNGVLDVVDGQQRLATTAVLLAAARDYLRGTHEDVLVEAINNEFLTGIDRSQRARVPKLRLNIDDNELFSRLVAGNPDDPMPPQTRSSDQYGLDRLDGRSPKKGRTWRRSRISVAARVVGLRVGSVDHSAHHSLAQRLNGSRPRRCPCQVLRLISNRFSATRSSA